jgi:hypothetical protein
VLCFDVSKNGKKLALAGLRESGVVSVILSWQGSRPGASGLAAAAKGRIPGLHFYVGGIDSSNPAGDDSVRWIQEERDFRIGDEIRIRFSASETPDAPVLREPSHPLSMKKDGCASRNAPFADKCARRSRRQRSTQGSWVRTCSYAHGVWCWPSGCYRKAWRASFTSAEPWITRARSAQRRSAVEVRGGRMPACVPRLRRSDLGTL